MVVTFNVNFHTEWGQKLYIVGSIPELGSGEVALAKEMTCLSSGGDWQLSLTLREDVEKIEYKYLVRTAYHTIAEWDKGHRLVLDKKKARYTLYDSWLNPPEDIVFYSSAFSKTLFMHSESFGDKGNITIRVLAPQVRPHQALIIVGNHPSLGHWSVGNAPEMAFNSISEWSFSFNAEEITSPLEYKFAIVDKNNRDICYWEDGDNRILNLSYPESDENIGFFVGCFRGKSLPLWKGAGAVIPVFSLRSEQSFGVGDLGDLRLFIDWIKKTKQCLVQVLPMNDTRMTQTWMDSYPYSAASIYALHPMYINLNQLGELKDESRRRYYEQKQIELNALAALDYEAVVACKIAYCREYFRQEGFDLLNDSDYRTFYESNKLWLVPYAAYCYLRDVNHTADFRCWQQFSVYDRQAIMQLCAPNSEAYPEVVFHYFLQYVLDKQFREVSSYARANGVVLKGDLPIGVNRYSAEVWTEPEYFNLDEQSGAPPDDFSHIGQNWLFPTYKWETMERDGFSWWRKRFTKLNDYFDCFRIDHILGFFRIWEIPYKYVQGLCGHFSPALPLSSDEIEQQYGLTFDEFRFTIPHVKETFLTDLFGDYADEVRSTYLGRTSANDFILKPSCDTQRKIEQLFANKNDDKSIRIKSGLNMIANEVLFLPDPHEQGKYHPRISASSSFVYKELTDEERGKFDHLSLDFFYYRHNDLWKRQALKILSPLINSTEMLICGEDLGMIPDSVPEVMQQLQLLSLEIERMPKASGIEFADVTRLPYLSVCTTSTHDMTPLRGWWKEDAGKTQRYYNNVLHREGEAPEDCCAEIAKQILTNHLCSDSMLVVIPLQDWLAIDDSLKRVDIEAERINIPARTNHYWNYRMHITIEQLLRSENFNKEVADLCRFRRSFCLTSKD